MDAEATPQAGDAALALRGSVVSSVVQARYRLAAALAAERRVLDAGCGLAAGTRVLGTAGPRSLIGVDRAASKLDAARPRTPAKVELRVAELTALPIADASVDLITCFGPLAGGEDDGLIVQELRRVLAPGGLLLVSLPADAAAVVRGMFPVCAVLSERRCIAALVGDAEPERGSLQSLVTAGAGDGQGELLLAASDSALPEFPVTIALSDELGLSELLDQADHLRAARDHLAGRLRAAERALAQRDAAAYALADCEARLADVPDLEVRLLAAERRAELAEAEAKLAIERAHGLGEVNAELERHRIELARCQATLEAIETSTSWRVTAPVRRVAGRARRGGTAGSG